MNSDKARTRIVIPPWEAAHAMSYTEEPAASTVIVDSFLKTYDPGFGVRKG